MPLLPESTPPDDEIWYMADFSCDHNWRSLFSEQFEGKKEGMYDNITRCRRLALETPGVVRFIDLEYLYGPLPGEPTEREKRRETLPEHEEFKLCSDFNAGIVTYLPKFTNLRSISIKIYPHNIRKALLEAVAKHPGIEEVLLTDGILTDCGNLSNLLKLKKFALNNIEKDGSAGTTNTFHILSGERLQGLILNSRSYAARILRGMVDANQQCRNLQTLSLGVLQTNDLPAFFSFLPTCPYLRSLKIWDIDRGFQPLNHPTFKHDFTRNLLPHLTEFTGTVELAMVVVPGRPVVSVKILGKPFDDGKSSSELRMRYIISQCLARSAAPLRSLTMSGFQVSSLAMWHLSCSPALLDLAMALGPGYVLPEGSRTHDPYYYLNILTIPIVPGEGIDIAGGLEETLSDYQKSFYTKFMRFLHLIAGNCVPPNIKTLSLWSNYLVDKKKLEPQPLQGDYTISKRLHILRTIGARYPALHKLTMNADDLPNTMLSFWNDGYGRWQAFFWFQTSEA